MVKSSQPVFHLCSIHRLKHLVVSGLQNSKSTDVSLRDQHIIYQGEGDREDKDKVISLIIMAQYFYGDGVFWRRYQVLSDEDGDARSFSNEHLAD